MANRVRYVASSKAVSPAADDRDLAVAEEEAVARRARRHAAPAQAGLAIEPEPQRRRPGGDDHRLRAVLRAARPDPERTLGEVHLVDIDIDQARAEALGLGAHRGHQVRTLDAVGEARVVLDVAREHQLATRRRAGQDDRFQGRARGIDRGRQPGRAGPHDQELRVDPAAGARDGRRATGRGRRGIRRDGEGRRRGRPSAGVSAEIDGQTAERFLVLHDRYRITFPIPPQSMAPSSRLAATAP